MNRIIFYFSGNEEMAGKIAASVKAEAGQFILHHFPDGETYIRILSDVRNKEVFIVCTLNDPDKKLLPLYFLCQTLRQSGCRNIHLIAPYLAYMRQDKSFSPGEGITSVYFAKLLSGFVDELITLDPHLHRIHTMQEIYDIPCIALHAAPFAGEWIKNNIQKPLVIGPDLESEQWVEEVAKSAGAPFIILNKTRLDDRSVKISVPDMKPFSAYTPVLVDDIISTARTLMETIAILKPLSPIAPVCVAIHAVFADDAFRELSNSGAGTIVTCNTIPHPSNKIDVSGLIAGSIQSGK